MAGMSSYLDSNGDPKTGAQIGDVTENVTTLNKSFFDNKIFTAIAAVIESVQGGSSSSGLRRDVDFSNTQAAIDSLPTS